MFLVFLNISFAKAKQKLVDTRISLELMLKSPSYTSFKKDQKIRCFSELTAAELRDFLKAVYISSITISLWNSGNEKYFI